MERHGVKTFADVEAAFEGLRSQREPPPGFNPDDFLPQLQYSLDGGRTVDRLKPTISAMVQADVKQSDASADFFDISVKFSTTRFVLSRSLDDVRALHKKIRNRVPTCAKTLPPLPTPHDTREAASPMGSGGTNAANSYVSAVPSEKHKNSNYEKSTGVNSNISTGSNKCSSKLASNSSLQKSFFGDLFFGNLASSRDRRVFSIRDDDDDNDRLAARSRSSEEAKKSKQNRSSSKSPAQQGGNVATRKLRSYLSQVIDWFRARRVYDPDVLEFLDLDADLLLRLHREDMRVVRNIVVSWGGHVAHALPLPWVNAFVQSITPHRRHGDPNDTTAGDNTNNSTTHNGVIPARHQPGPIELRKLLDDGEALAAMPWALVTKPAWIVLSTVYGADMEMDLDTLRKLLLDHSISSSQAGLDHPPTSLLGLPVATPS